MKRVRFLKAVFLCLVCLILLSTVFAYSKFSDVPNTAWYYSDVENSVKMGLISGKSAKQFCPDDNMTYAEAVKLASCMHQKYTEGSVKLKNGNPWYQNYVAYAKKNGIISQEYAWNAKITRADCMKIFAHALPSYAFATINMVFDGSIPDVPMGYPQAEEIYLLCRSGIVQGSGSQMNCNPNSNIKRCEVAAILTRMMDESKRIYFSNQKNIQYLKAEDAYSVNSYIRTKVTDQEWLTDNYGNGYSSSRVFCNRDSGIFYDTGEIEFYIGGQYSTVTGTIYVPSVSRSIRLSTGSVRDPHPPVVQIYGDDVLLYERSNLAYKDKAESFSVNITGVDFLKVTVEGGWYRGDGTGLIPVNCIADLAVQ